MCVGRCARVARKNSAAPFTHPVLPLRSQSWAIIFVCRPRGDERALAGLDPALGVTAGHPFLMALLVQERPRIQIERGAVLARRQRPERRAVQAAQERRGLLGEGATEARERGRTGDRFEAEHFGAMAGSLCSQATRESLSAPVRMPPKPRRPGPPHNPGVRDLVSGKGQWSSGPKSEDARQGFRGWHERGYLPHRDEPGVTQFVTFRLVDTFPGSLRSEWEHLWRIEDNRERRTELEAYLDRERGECYLRQPEIARLVEDNLLNFSGCCGSQTRAPAPRYELRAWCILPNHVHVLFKVGSASMSETVGAWKKHTGRLANRMLRKTGAFWAEDYFDIYMRDGEHEERRCATSRAIQ
jgi:hypothetical protein